MPRARREKHEHGTFLIEQFGSDLRPLFKDDGDRTKFLDILKKAEEKFQFRLLGFCLSDKNRYRLLLDVNGGDISKIMKSINIAYAIYASCPGKLYKDRYRSKLLDNPEEFEDAKACFREDKEGILWNSFHIDESELTLHPVLKYFREHTDPTSNSSERVCVNCIQTLDEGEKRLMEQLRKDQRSLENPWKDKDYRNGLIREFRRSSTLSLRELGALFGGLSESSVSKILNR